ncbi:hypothetical protein [Lysobacter gummosus]|uniref:hypothetical protein n=1 Tax=Lysobacter gummosus TaxID=262324 RepID=UPI0036317080
MWIESTQRYVSGVVVKLIQLPERCVVYVFPRSSPCPSTAGAPCAPINSEASCGEKQGFGATPISIWLVDCPIEPKLRT